MGLDATTEFVEECTLGESDKPEDEEEESRDPTTLDNLEDPEILAEIAALRRALEEKSLPGLSALFIDFLLRNQVVVYEQIRTRRGLRRISLSLVIMTIFLTGFYGSTMGMHNGLRQMASSAIKLPLLFLATAGICLPTLYVFNVLIGQRFRFLQTVALLTSALGTTSILLGSLAPVALFFTWTGSSYPFLKLLHVCFVGVAGLFGVQYLYRGCRHVAEGDGGLFQSQILRLWILIYSVVGMQLGWRLRPFLGAQDRPFELLRAVQGNFYTAVLQSVRDLI